MPRTTALVVLILAGCEAGSGAAPGDADPLRLTASDVNVVATSEAIAQVRDLEALPDGSVWLLNSVEPFFIGFDAEGRSLGGHGTAGGGPEEFRAPAGLVVGGWDGEAWTFDYARHAFFRVSEPNRAWSEVPIPRDEIPAGTVRGGMNLLEGGVRTARLGDELIVPWTTGTMESGIADYHLSLLQATLAALDPQTGSVREVVDLGQALEDPSAGFVPSGGGFPLWYRLWAVCGDQVRVHDRVRNRLRGFTAAGQEIDRVDLPAVQLTEVTPLEFARAVFPLRQAEVTGEVGARLTQADSVRLLNQMAQGFSGEPHDLAAYLPRYVDFRCADDGTMWLQPIDLEIGGLDGGPLWLRISMDGAVREVRLPERFDPFRFTSDRIWGVQRDELDVASVAWIALSAG